MCKISGILLNKIIIILIIASLLIFTWQCKDFFEEDLSNKIVNVLAPEDSLKTSVYSHNFWWDPLEGAQKYNLQIVTPSFDHISRLVVDTNLTGNIFSYTLSSGSYQWRVTAFNASSFTEEFYVMTILIDTTLELTGEKIILEKPGTDFYTNKTRVEFKWTINEKADYYEFTIRKDNWAGELVLNKEEYKKDTISFVLNEGIYEWGVIGFNELTHSLLVTRKVTVDITAPVVSKLISTEDTIKEPPVVFKWINSASLAPVSDSIFIAHDSLFTDIVEKYYTSDTTYTMDIEDDGTYFWRVRSFDAAGNISQEYSKHKKFVIENEE